jgi:dTDP-glucose pyrophosphorylase
LTANADHDTSSDTRWRRALLGEGSAIQDAVRSLDQSGLQIVLVVGADEKLIGTITDGDIRRGLLRGLTMTSPIADIVYRQPLVVPPQFGVEMVLHLMQANKVHQLPVVDARGCVIGLHLWTQLIAPSNRSNAMIIMAGGRGVRLHPHTENCPKPLLPVGGKPMLEHIIERAKAQGFHRFILAVHFLGHMIEEYFGDGSRWGVQIEYLREETPLGTAGAISLLEQRPAESFLVSNGDVLADIHYGELLDFHRRHGASGTMAVRLHEWQHPFGVVRTEGVDIVGFEEKPVSRSHVNAGIYVLEPSTLDALSRGEYCDMPMLFARLQERHVRTIVYPMHEPWLDVGRSDDLARAREMKGKPD